MWSPEPEQTTTTTPHHHHHHHGHQRRTTTSSSTTSSSSSKSCSSNSSILPQSPRRGRSLEEVWKGITLSAPMFDQNHPHQQPFSIHHHSTTTPSRGMILQDFLARPFNDTTSASTAPPPAEVDLPRPPPPATILSLNSTGFHYLDSIIPTPSEREAPDITSNSHLHHHHHPNNNNDDDDRHRRRHPSPFISAADPTTFSDAIGSPSPGIFSFCSKRRLSEQDNRLDDNGDANGGGGGGDPRHKRMIKNRESAARSRARKQAYTNELELEVTRLAQENSKLKRQHEELRLAMAAQLPTKKTLQRTSTSPF